MADSCDDIGYDIDDTVQILYKNKCIKTKKTHNTKKIHRISYQQARKYRNIDNNKEVLKQIQWEKEQELYMEEMYEYQQLRDYYIHPITYCCCI